MSNSPLVSAIIPTYNRADVVFEAVDSVLGQTYSNLEVIVVDDGSADETVARLRRYGDRIRLVSQENAGPAVARNRGVAVSRGEYIAFLDSDDLWLPTKVEQQVVLLEKAGKSVPCCLCNIMMRWYERDIASFEIASLKPSADEGIWVNADEILATRFVLFNQGIVIRRDVLERIGGFDESLRLLEDHELALRLSLEGPWSFIKEPLVIWRETAGSLYHEAHTEEICSKAVQILEKQLARLNEDHRHTTLRRHLNRELKRARRSLWATQVSQKTSWGASRVGESLLKIEQYRSAVFRRSPWFPKMMVTRLAP